MSFDFHKDAPNSVCQIIATIESRDLNAPYLVTDLNNAKGTGFFVKIGDELYVITASHVVYFAQKIHCIVPNQRADSKELLIVNFLPELDIAILKFADPSESQKVQPTNLGSDSDLKLGIKLYAMGYPLGDQQLKVVPASFNGRRQWLQIDGAMNPGISGGPVVTEDGKVMGIVVKGVNPDKVANVTIAVPINFVKNFFHLIHSSSQNEYKTKILPIVQTMLRFATVNRATLEQVYKGNEGVMVIGCGKTCPFFDTALKVNDLLQTISIRCNNHFNNSFKVDKYGMIYVENVQKQPLPIMYAMEQIVPGCEVQLDCVHPGGEKFSVVKKFNDDYQNLICPRLSGFMWTLDPIRSDFLVFAGLLMQNMTSEFATTFKYNQYPSFFVEYDEPMVIVTSILPTSEIGILMNLVKPGEIISEIDDQKISNLNDVRRVLFSKMLKSGESGAEKKIADESKKIYSAPKRNKQQDQDNRVKGHTISIQEELENLKLPVDFKFKTKSDYYFMIHVDEKFIQKEINVADDRYPLTEKILFLSDDKDDSDESKPSTSTKAENNDSDQIESVNLNFIDSSFGDTSTQNYSLMDDGFEFDKNIFGSLLNQI